MPRGKRINIPGGIYHVIVRGIERRKIFQDNKDRKEFISRLESSLKKTKSRCYAWVLMPNHVHLMVRTGEGSLSELMRRVLTGYALYFNRRHKRHGYLFQNRYKSVLCQEDVYFKELIRYIHLNPIRAKIVEGIIGVDRYSWSGHAAIIGERDNEWQDINEVLLWFGNTRKEAIRQYRKFIEEGIAAKNPIDFMGGGLVRSAGGWGGVLKLKSNKEYWRGDERILGDDEFVTKVLKVAGEKLDRREALLREGWNLEKVVGKVCELLKINPDDLKKKGKANIISEAKGLICYWGYNELGVSGKKIGEFLGISRPAVSKNIHKGEIISKEKDIKLTS